MIIFLNLEGEVFDYSETLFEYKNFYVPREKDYIPKKIVSKYEFVETIPNDYMPCKYKYVNGEFVLNENYEPPQEENEPKE